MLRGLIPATPRMESVERVVCPVLISGVPVSFVQISSSASSASICSIGSTA